MRAVYVLILTSACALLTACALPAHNNTLIFGIKRDVGVGIKGPSESSASVELLLGYSERQFAWVPIWANTAFDNGKAVPMPCPSLSSDKPEPGSGSAAPSKPVDFKQVNCNYGPKLLADGDGSAINNGRFNDGHDALSTFASFGGDLQGSFKGDSTSNVGASVGGKLASFFATGIAAQNLSKHGGLVSPVFGPQKALSDSTEQDNQLQIVQEQMDVVAQYIATTGAGDDVGSKRTVRTECSAVLAKRADLTGDVLEQFNKLSAPAQPASSVTVAEWKDRWFDVRKTFVADLPYLSRAAEKLSKEYAKKTRDGGDSKAAEAICGAKA